MNKKGLSAVAFLSAAILLLVAYYYSYDSFMKYFYPVHYKDTVLSYSEEYSVEPHRVFAVIKNESGFDPNAVSSIGARGLMQITEETFVWLASKDELSGAVSFDDMFNPETNIRFGVFLLSLAQEKFSSDSAVYSSYHAGFGITEKWLKNEEYSKDGITLESVPYEDTRKYIKKVIKTEDIYKKLYGGNYD